MDHAHGPGEEVLAGLTGHRPEGVPDVEAGCREHEDREGDQPVVTRTGICQT